MIDRGLRECLAGRRRLPGQWPGACDSGLFKRALGGFHDLILLVFQADPQRQAHQPIAGGIGVHQRSRRAPVALARG